MTTKTNVTTLFYTLFFSKHCIQLVVTGLEPYFV